MEQVKKKITKNIVKYLVKISLDKFTKILYYINNTRITTGKNRRTCVYCAALGHRLKRYRMKKKFRSLF